LLACFVSEKPLPSRIRHGEDTVEKIRANTMLFQLPKPLPNTNTDANSSLRTRSLTTNPILSTEENQLLGLDSPRKVMSAEEETQVRAKIEQTDKKLDAFLENQLRSLDSPRKVISAEEETQVRAKIDQTDKKLDEFLENQRRGLDSPTRRVMSAEEETQVRAKIEQTDKKLDEFLESQRKILEQGSIERTPEKPKPENGTSVEDNSTSPTPGTSNKAKRLSRGLTNLTLNLFRKKSSS